MAYKFQLGKAVLSGSVVAKEEVFAKGGLEVTGAVDLPASSIQNAELANSEITINGYVTALGASVTLDTGDVAEGENLYFTNARAKAAISVNDVSGDGSLTYDSGSGVITYTGPSASEVRAHLSAGDGLSFAGGQFAVTSSIAGAGLAWSAGVLSVDTAEIADGLSGSVENIIDSYISGGVGIAYSNGTASLAFNEFSTTDLVEGSKLFFTDARARAAVSAVDAGGDGSFSYNSATGVFTYTGPSATETRAHFSALTGAAYQNGNIQYNTATGQITLQPVEESWVRQRLGAVDAVKYNLGSGQISLQLTGSSLFQDANGLRVQDSYVRNLIAPVDTSEVDMAYNASTGQISATLINASIGNDRLINSSVTVNGTAGEVLVSTPKVDLGGNTTISLPNTITKNLAFSGEVTINKLNVTGTLTTVNTENLEIKDARILMASGSTGWATGVGFDFGSHVDHGTLLTAEVDLNGDGVGAADNVLSSSLPLVAPSMKAGTFYGNFVGASILGIVTEGASTATISANVTRANNASQVLTLPSAPAVGQEHRIKCVVADASSPVITIQPASGAKLEGVVDAQITLESYGAAISLVWGGSSEGWMVF